MPVGAAAIATVLLAVAFGLAANQLTTSPTRPEPHLRTVSNATLTRLGLSLSAAVQPPHCGLADGAALHGWLPAGSVGCAITQTAAEAMARQGGSGTVIESLLALVTSTRPAAIGYHHLTWLVVTQNTASYCGQSGGGFSTCLGQRGFTRSQLVLVDGHGAGIINTLRLGAGGRVARPISPGGMLNSG
ncbi:MAG TPA: hypothetical protein VGO86_03730 [Candidatus Dormibacteraeota bacterium]